MKDSTILILAGLLCQFLVLLFAVKTTQLLPLVTFCGIGIALLTLGFNLLLSDN